MRSSIKIILLPFLLSLPFPAYAQSEPFLGQLMIFGGNFCPRNWAEANGQLLAISENTALFMLFGTMYGGNGQTTFGLPDLRGRAPIHKGQGVGLTNREQGKKYGQETVTLSTGNLPSHTHSLNNVELSGRINASAAGGTTNTATGAVLGDSNRTAIYRQDAADVSLAEGSVTVTGDANTETAAAGLGQAHDNMPPVQALIYCVSLQGQYPSRN
jgi:microcystin-dependent protein